MSVLRPNFNVTAQAGLPTNLNTSQVVFPDLVVCDMFYGSHLSLRNAEWAESDLPWGSNPVTWYLDQPDEHFTIPFERESEFVKVQVEYAGAFRHFSNRDAPPIPTITLIPDNLHEMATAVIDKCVRSDGLGGFATARIQNLLDYVVDPDNEITSLPYPASTLFITVTVGSQPRDLPNPGIYDEHIAKALESAERGSAGDPTITSATRRLLLQRAEKWRRQAILMRVSLRHWWDFEDGPFSSIKEMNGTQSTNQTQDSVFGDGVEPVQVSKE